MKDPQGMFSRFGVSGLRLWGFTLNPEFSGFGVG